MATDSWGLPLKMHFTPGNDHDSTAVRALIDFIPGKHCIADKAYDADWILAELRDRELKPVIPSNRSRIKQRRHNKKLYALRYLVECCFHNLKRCRRIATRFDKTIASYAGFVHVAGILAWIV